MSFKTLGTNISTTFINSVPATGYREEGEGGVYEMTANEQNQVLDVINNNGSMLIDLFGTDGSDYSNLKISFEALESEVATNTSNLSINTTNTTANTSNINNLSVELDNLTNDVESNTAFINANLIHDLEPSYELGGSFIITQEPRIINSRLTFMARYNSNAKGTLDIIRFSNYKSATGGAIYTPSGYGYQIRSLFQYGDSLFTADIPTTETISAYTDFFFDIPIEKI